jgi:hypothetical protein
MATWSADLHRHVHVVLDHDDGVALLDECPEHVQRRYRMSSKWRPVVGSSRM